MVHAGGVFHVLSDRLLMCNRRRPAATSSRRASFSALASANSFCVFCIERSNITLTHLHVSNCRSPVSSRAFCRAAGLCGNGVITVMINSPRQADDDADNQSGDNRGDSAHTSISLTVPPASLNFGNQLSGPCSERSEVTKWHEAQILLQRSRSFDGYHHDQS